MIYISHRGNMNGPDEKHENHPDYIRSTLGCGVNVEIDVWKVKDQWWLGHDIPQYEVSLDFLLLPYLWLHAKNIEAMVELMKHILLHCFWHENDVVTLTSRGFIWAYPGKPIVNSIAVMPEKFPQYNDELDKCLGICSDFIQRYVPVTA